MNATSLKAKIRNLAQEKNIKAQVLLQLGFKIYCLFFKIFS